MRQRGPARNLTRAVRRARINYEPYHSERERELRAEHGPMRDHVPCELVISIILTDRAISPENADVPSIEMPAVSNQCCGLPREVGAVDAKAASYLMNNPG